MCLVGVVIVIFVDVSWVLVGNVLVVDCDVFSVYVIEQVKNYFLIEVVEGEVEIVFDGICVIVFGLLIVDVLVSDLRWLIGFECLSFYDVVVFVIDVDFIDMDIVWWVGCYDQSVDYINCLFIKEEYLVFFEVFEIVCSYMLYDWEKLEFFEGCMFIEEIVCWGVDILCFGLMFFKGLDDFKIGCWFYVVVQLCQEDVEGCMWLLVGFQIGLKWGDQKVVV